jgi:hypothetical protein
MIFYPNHYEQYIFREILDKVKYFEYY